MSGFWLDWRDAPNPQWHEDGETEYRLKFTLELLTELSKTPEGIHQVRVEMLELDGWTPFLMDDGSQMTPPRWVSPEDRMVCTLDHAPNYPEDLDAVHRMESKLHSSQQWSWAEELRRVLRLQGKACQQQECLNDLLWGCARATALQRCIVLLLTNPPQA